MKSNINIIASILIISGLILTSCSSKGKFENKLQGKIKRESIAIAPKVPGRIIKIKVKESDIVKAGDTLAEINIPEVEAKLLQAEGAYISAKAQYQMALNGATEYERMQINAKYAADNEQYILADKSFKRIKDMYKDSLIAAQKYDEVLAKFNLAKAQLDATNAQKKDIERGVRPEKVQMALGDMKRAEGAFKEAQAAYSEKFIIAPQDMTIETIALKEGELLLPGYNLFVGYEINGSYFRFTINEKEITKFNKGQIYSIEIPDKNININAKLINIKQMASYAEKTSSYANYELGESVYELKLIAENPDEMKNLYANMTVLIDNK